MRLKLIISIIFLFNAYVGSAQVSPMGDIDSTFEDTMHIKEVRAQAFTPFGLSSISNFFSNISISSFFNEGVNGKIELQGRFNSRWSGGLSIDQKIGKNDKAAIPLALSGISPGTTVAFNVQKITWKPKFDFSKLSDQEVAKKDKIQDMYAKRNGIADPRTIGLRDLYINGTNEEKRLALAVFESRHFKQPFLANFKVGFTKTAFSYSTDSATLKTVDNAFITPTVTFSLIKTLGAAFKVTGFIALSYNFSESYNAADDMSFNIPFGTTGNYYTNTLSFGVPTKRTSNNVMLELRQNIYTQFKGGNLMNIAVSPSATLDINNKKFGIFLPVYLIRGSDKDGKLIDGLQGGIRFGYITSTESGKVSSFKNGISAQLMVSQPLDFISKF